MSLSSLGSKRRAKETLKPQWLLKYLKSKGITEEQISAVIDGTGSGGIDDAGVMPVESYLQLLNWTAQRFDIPHLGLQLASEIELEDFGILGFLITNGRTFSEAFRIFERYKRILTQGASTDFIEHDDCVELRYSVITEFAGSIVHDVEFALASIVSLARYMGAQVTIQRVCFCHKKIEPVAAYGEWFGDRVYFEQPNNSIWVSQEDWCQTLSAANSGLLNILKVQANQLLSKLEARGDFVEHIRFLINTNLGNEMFNVEALASHLNVTSRTLHRRLEQQGTTFKKLRIEIAMEAGCRALADTDASIAEIAQQLGYADSSGFVRAFKKSQGIPPLQFRKRHMKV